ncbi:MAG: SCP2 sterol-binding domain-containing protein [Acidimicrobiia bacterium]
MPAYPFLSDEWFVEVRRVLDDGAVEVPADASLRANLSVTDTPFGDDRLLHLAIGDGAAEWDHGHLDDADLTITTDYATARELFVAGDPQGALQALMQGKLKLQGDLTKLLALQMAGTGPGSPGLGAALAEITV